jgi:HlyD family secretion protein
VIWGIPMIKLKMAFAGLALFAFAGSCGWLAAMKGPTVAAQAGTGQQAGPPDEKAKSDRGEVIRSTVPGQITVIMMAHDGSKVKKGDVVSQLDSSALADQLLEQHIAVESARANYESSQLDREVAEIAVVHYVEGSYKLEALETNRELQIAEAELALAEDRFESVTKASTKGIDLQVAKFARKRAMFSLEIAQTRRKVLSEFDKPRRIKELKSAVQKARSSELAQKTIWDLHMSKAKRIESQIERCTIRAPQDGTVHYRGGVGPREGTMIREGERLFEIIP